MTADLHTHILCGIDDGAATVEESIKLLQMEAADGVGTVALTPHYRPGQQALDEFLTRRQEAYEVLCERMSGDIPHRGVSPESPPITLLLAAEVAFSAELTEADLTPLCFDGTKTILIELPTDHCPQRMREILSEILFNGFTPILAHIERYSYIMNDRRLLESIADCGIKTQVNAGTLLGTSAHSTGSTRRQILSLIQDNLIHIIATDTHGVTRRPPQLRRALQIAEKKTGTAIDTDWFSK